MNPPSNQVPDLIATELNDRTTRRLRALEVLKAKPSHMASALGHAAAFAGIGYVVAGLQIPTVAGMLIAGGAVSIVTLLAECASLRKRLNAATALLLLAEEERQQSK